MEPSSPDTESLYDFMYVDGAKVSTYMAQLDPNGSLTGITTTSTGTTTLDADAKLSAVLASGKVKISDLSGEAAQRQFDPLFALPLAMMNRLDELRLIHRVINGTSIGSLVLLKGYCRLVNIALIKEMWPSIADAVEDQLQEKGTASANRHVRRAEAVRKSGPPSSPTKNLLRAIEKLPHAIQLQMVCPEQDGGALAWGTLKPDCLLTSADDIGLKYGSALPGEWYVLGVLDCGPIGTELSELWNNIVGVASDLSRSIASLTDLIRSQMGRPDGWNGITPILIFRKLPQRPTD